MKVAILIDELVEDSEFIYPLYRFKEEKWDVDVIGTTVKSVKGKKGGIFKTEKSIDSILENDYDILFIPGGYAPDRLRRNKKILDFVSAMYNKGKIIGSICHGPWVLISAGIVKEKKITGYYAIKDDIINSGAIYTGNPVEADGNLFTGTDPDAMPHLLHRIIEYAKSGG